MKRVFHGGLLIKLIFILALVLLSSVSSLKAATSPDAIAFRVMPNSDHLSPLRWYQENIKVKGSPQALIVDGYEAVRDGRTVYVNAANISDSTFYTNIYIISYNQQAENATIDIFGQILVHWKFNTNISDSDPAGAHCSKTARACLNSPECPAGEYCLSQKAKIIRDTKRLADLADLRFSLANYQVGHNGDYPALSAGSYLAGKSISTWPSWRAALGTALGITLPLDPVNKLGACPGYDPTTCWDEKTKKFAGVLANSRVYVYTYASKSYNICALMESNYSTNLSPGSCGDGSATHAVGYTVVAP